jgi:hypothetical protein
MIRHDNNGDGLTPRRFINGPRALGALLPKISRQALRKTNVTWALILTDWEAIVGPKIAGTTIPRRLNHGQLTIACAGPVAMALHYESTQLINRINTYLGGQPVQALRFTQATAARKPDRSPKPPPEAVQEAEAAMGDFPPGELRTALASLGAVVLGRSKSRVSHI